MSIELERRFVDGAVLCLAASALAAVAAVVSSLDGDADLVPFFVILTFGAGLAAWAVHGPQSPTRRLFGRVLGAAWIVAALWIAGLLVMYQVTCGCSMGGPPSPADTYLGLPATVYHLAATYLGGALVVVGIFRRASRRSASEAPPA